MAKSGKELIAEIAKRRKEYNYWKAKATSAKKKVLAGVRKFPAKQKELYNEKLERLTKNL